MIDAALVFDRHFDCEVHQQLRSILHFDSHNDALCELRTGAYFKTFSTLIHVSSPVSSLSMVFIVFSFGILGDFFTHKYPGNIGIFIGISHRGPMLVGTIIYSKNAWQHHYLLPPRYSYKLPSSWTRVSHSRNHLLPTGDLAPSEFPYYTPPKTNMEPENEPLEEEIPVENHHF